MPNQQNLRLLQSLILHIVRALVLQLSHKMADQSEAQALQIDAQFIKIGVQWLSAIHQQAPAADRLSRSNGY